MARASSIPRDAELHSRALWPGPELGFESLPIEAA
jgi:hypothetical protein